MGKISAKAAAHRIAAEIGMVTSVVHRALGNPQGAAQPLFGHWPRDQPDHDRRNRIAIDPHQEPMTPKIGNTLNSTGDGFIPFVPRAADSTIPS